jgi:phenylalanyl-tRNA synthetase beta chain
VGGLWSGSALPEQWGAPTRNVDFFDVKGDLEALFAGQALSFEKLAHPALHPGRAARVSLGGTPIGFEIGLEAWLSIPMPAYREVSRFPAVTRDLAMTVARDQSLAPLLAAFRSVAPDIVQEIRLFDVYLGKGLPEGQKSVAFRIVMQDTERTLEDRQVDAVVAGFVSVAVEQFGGALRS